MNSAKHHKIILLVSIHLIACWHLSSCTSNSDFNSFLGKKSDSSGGRPTDETEGVEGYLTDPELVVIERKENKVTRLEGKPGAIGSIKNSPEGVTVAAWDVERQDDWGTSGKLQTSGENVGCTTAAADGSFSMAVGAYQKSLLLTVNQPCDNNEIIVPPSETILSALIEDSGTQWDIGLDPKLPNLAGDYVISGLPAKIVQMGDILTLTNERGDSVTGSFTSPTRILVPAWGDLGATVSANDIKWDNDTLWTRGQADFPSISGTYEFTSLPASVDQDGGKLTFTNENGGISPGHFLSSTRVIATAWNDLQGTIGASSIKWDNDSEWVRK